MENGLTRDELAETVTHLAFYAGWPKAMSAVPVLAKVAADRMQPAQASDPGEPVKVIRSGANARLGAAEHFVGTVRVDTPFSGSGGAHVGGARVTFEPGARTAWHKHPLGQTLVVTAGRGWVQREGGPVEEIGPGDTAWIGPGVKHWHGATPTEAVTHIAIAEAVDGKSVEWMEQVGDAEYRRGPLAAAAAK